MSGQSRDLTDEIIAKLDVRAEYEKLGVKIAAGQPNSNGWLGCFAYGREDKNQSAAINIHTGCYTDRGSKFASGLFDFSVHCGQFADWREARKHYAIIVGMEKNLPRKKSTDVKRLQDRIDLSPGWNPLVTRGIVAIYPGITDLALQMAGCELGMWPKGSREAEHVVAMPVYGQHLIDAPPVGYIICASSGRNLKTQTGEKKRLVIESTGLVNRRGLAMMSDGRARLIIKVEGYTDLLAMQSEIVRYENGKYLDMVAVISNACGANESTLPGQVAPLFAGIPTVIIHDADVPGQDGAKLWAQELGKFTTTANVQLPYAIEEKHGKDLRDYLNEPRNLRNLLDMILEQFPGFFSLELQSSKQPEVLKAVALEEAPFDPSPSNSVKALEIPERQKPAVQPNLNPPSLITPFQLILKRIGMIALGVTEGTSEIEAFCERNGRAFRLQHIANLKLADLVLHLGPEIMSEINTGSEPDPTKLTIDNIRLAIAAEASRNRLSSNSYYGVGIWEINGRLLLVNAGEATIVNCVVSKTTIPIVDNKIFDFGDSKKWFDHSWFVQEFEKNQDREYSMGVLNEAIEIFARWDNWRHSKTPEIVAALICCTWIQNVWDWRPQACITGATNSGKTMLIRTVRAMFADGAMAVGGMSPSAAGLRQKLKNTSKGVFIDEFEPHSKHRKECLDMFRGMSRGDAVPRGTAGSQRGMDFIMKHLPWHGAISAEVREAADRNRYLMIELDHVKKGRGSTLQLPSNAECCAVGMKLMVVACKYWQQAKEMAVAIKKAHIEGVDRRLVESFSVPCAMLSVVIGLSEDEAIQLTKDVIAEQDLDEQSESDEQSLLRDIMESPVQLEGGKQATMSLLVKGSFGSAYGATDAMTRCGVKRVDLHGVEHLFFSESSICANLFRDPARKNTGVMQILGRIKGAKKCRQYMGAHRPYGIMLPLTTVESMLGVTEGTEIEQQQLDPYVGSRETSVVF
jgi:hypothetical protein